MEALYEIAEVRFGVFSEDEIHKLSVAKIDSQRLTGVGSVYDERLGFSTDDNPEAKCVTCGLDNRGCPGHFGHIEFVEPIIHPKYFGMVVSYLKCFCVKCYTMLVDKDQIALEGLTKYKRNSRFDKILEKLKKINMCYACNATQPNITVNTQENTINLVYKQKSETTTVPLTVQEIKAVLDSIKDEDVETLGFSTKLIHPRNLIINSFPVLPPCARPIVVTEDEIADDHLTIQYVEIIKANNALRAMVENPETADEVKRMKHIQTLKFRVATLIDNRQEKAKHPTNGKPIKCINGRLSSKTGLIRGNLMGKRCEQTARTVIGPDPTLRMGQLAVPVEIASNLTVPETVTDFNKDALMKLISDGKANFVIRKNKKNRINLNYALCKRGFMLMYNDTIIRKNGKEVLFLGQHNVHLESGDRVKRNGVLVTDMDRPTAKHFELEVGDIVERQLRNGDIVLLNRQPTLHKGSMMAQEVVIRPCKTLRFNLSINKSFNADFDGDEMNIHVPQSYEARAELMNLSATKFNMVSAQSSKPNIVIVQDSLLGAYMMTKSDDKISKDEFFNIAAVGINQDGSYWTPDYILNRIQHIRRVLKKFGKKIQSFNGKGLFSLLLPEDFNYTSKNGAMATEEYVRIHKGVIYEGAINKVDIGGSHNSIIQLLYKEYGADTASTFVDNIQFITNSWLTNNGFTVGIKDCIPKKEDEIFNVIERCFVEAKSIEDTTHHAGIKEMRVAAALNKARDVGLRIAKNALDGDNNFISTVTSGSKGDYFNIAQITGLLGQQNLVGQRVPKHLNQGHRTLPHYPFENLTKEMEYESRGFIKHSFIHGLNPQEFYFHAMSGREGITDTAMGTSSSGYIQRRIIKVLEDMCVRYDGSVRNTEGNIYQFVYGDNGYDAAQTILKGGKSEVCDVSRLVEKLNMKYSK